MCVLLQNDLRKFLYNLLHFSSGFPGRNFIPLYLQHQSAEQAQSHFLVTLVTYSRSFSTAKSQMQTHFYAVVTVMVIVVATVEVTFLESAWESELASVSAIFDFLYRSLTVGSSNLWDPDTNFF
jgi:hypothetical protein